MRGPDLLADLADPVDDDGMSRPAEAAKRTFGHSKDLRPDLPQVVIAMAAPATGSGALLDLPGQPERHRDIRTVKDELAGWNLHRMVWVADRGFASAANRAYLTRGGGHYIHAEKLRHTNTEAAAALARPGGTPPWQATCESRTSRSHPAGTATATSGARTHGSWSATTPNKPNGTPPCGPTSSSTSPA